MNQISRYWDPASEVRLVDLQKMCLSASKIADAMGITRNAVISKLHRMGLRPMGGKSVSFDPRFWTEEKTATLRRLWALKEPASIIASAVGAKSASAVLNKAKKIGLAARPRTYPLKSPRRFRLPPLKLANIPPPSDQFKCTLLELGNDTCRWPLWDDDTKGAKFYCGTPEADCIEGKPYCRWHSEHSCRKDHEMEPFR